MTKVVNRISTYRKGETLMICSEVLLENGKPGYELLIVDEHVYKGRNKSFQKAPYAKIFTSKKQANNYALAIIRKEGYERI